MHEGLGPEGFSPEIKACIRPVRAVANRAGHHTQERRDAPLVATCMKTAR